MLDFTKNIKDKYLTQDDYKFSPDSGSLKLADQVISYNSGDIWKIIPLLIMLSYPIIYDKYSFNNESYDITIILCPLTLRCIIFKGLFEYETYQEHKMVLQEKNTENLIPIDLGIKIDEKYVIHPNKRTEVKISTLRSILVITPDPIYLELKYNLKKKIIPLIDISYYSNYKDINGNELNVLIHPKTLVYVIQYKSFTTNKEKTTIVLGRNITKNKVTGYNTQKSGIFEYLEKHKQKIINKSGFIMPMLWYLAKDAYMNAKVVYISN